MPNTLIFPNWIPAAITTDSNKMEWPMPPPHNKSLIQSINNYLKILLPIKVRKGKKSICAIQHIILSLQNKYLKR